MQQTEEVQMTIDGVTAVLMERIRLKMGIFEGICSQRCLRAVPR